MDLAAQDGLSVNLVHFSEIWPFPAEAASLALRGAKRTFAVENNATAQFARLLRAETGHQVTGSILKFDGRPFSPAYIVDAAQEGGGLIMVKMTDYAGSQPSWCPGCGNFGILNAVKKALVELDLNPTECSWSPA